MEPGPDDYRCRQLALVKHASSVAAERFVSQWPGSGLLDSAPNTVWKWGSFQSKSRPRSWVVGGRWWADGHHAPAAGGGVWGWSSYYSSANKMVRMRRVFCASPGLASRTRARGHNVNFPEQPDAVARVDGTEVVLA